MEQFLTSDLRSNPIPIPELFEQFLGIVWTIPRGTIAGSRFQEQFHSHSIPRNCLNKSSRNWLSQSTPPPSWGLWGKWTKESTSIFGWLPVAIPCARANVFCNQPPVETFANVSTGGARRPGKRFDYWPPVETFGTGGVNVSTGGQ